jgi:hypothetical protein
MFMNDRMTLMRLAAMCTILASACSHSNPAQPSAGAGTNGNTALTGSVGAPRPLTPGNNASIRNSDQPVTLAVRNGVSTKPGAVYTIEVATDAGFSAKVQTKDSIAEGANGQTSVKLDPLPAAKDYYWRARLTAGGTIGVFGATSKFTVGPAIAINAPIAVAPVAGAATSGQPTFTVTNATRTGPVGSIFYRFDVSTTGTFATIAITSTVLEGAGQTSFTPATGLAANTTYFWRATALDPTNDVSSPASTTLSFITSMVIDLTKVVYLKGPDLSTWKQTGQITSIEQDGSGAAGGPMCIAFTDPGWPDAKWIYGGNDPNFGVYGNQWYFANINGTWYGGPGEWLYRGAAVCKAGQGTTTIGPDSGFGPPFSNWVPKPGELVGYAVSASARALPAMATVQERTDVVLRPWHDSSLQAFSGQAIKFKR